jgi:hypothetical protein
MPEIKIIDLFDEFTDNWDEDEETMELEYHENLAKAMDNLLAEEED